MFTMMLERNRSDDLPATSRHVRYERKGNQVVPFLVDRAWLNGKWSITRVRRVRWRDVVQLERIPDDQRRDALWVMREVADLYRASRGCGFAPCSCPEGEPCAFSVPTSDSHLTNGHGGPLCESAA